MRFLKRATILGFSLFLIAFIGFGIYFYRLVQAAAAQMPSIEDKFNEVAQVPSRILTADGVELYRVSQENRIPVHFSEVPKHVRDAIVAAEDKRFYEHSGVDVVGLARAASLAVKDHRVSQGGSTITMQLAKQIYNGSDRSFNRKMEDIAYAYAMEQYLGNKNRILELYMNWVYFGETAHGIGAAAKVYFNKRVDQLTISDAALLARCVRLPSKENPIKNFRVAMENRDVVLRIMREENMITESQYQDALAEKPKLNPNPPNTTAAYSAGFAQYVVDQVIAQIRDEYPNIDLKEGGYTIYTTIDSKLQKAAERAVTKRVREYAQYKVNSATAITIDRDGKILCEVGGVDYRKNKHNIATMGLLQPGSGFKPFLYSVALRDGIIKPDSYLSNAVITFGEGRDAWTPQNSSPREDRSSYSLADAIALSINRPAVHTIKDLTPQVLVQAAHDSFGFRSELRPFPSLALGSSEVHPIEMAEAYSVFMLHGDRVHPYVLNKIVDPDGKTVAEEFPKKYASVFDPTICEQMDGFLEGVVQHGTAYRALHDFGDARGKTGTTNDARDAWFDGYADGVLTIAWVGNQKLVHGKWTRYPMAGNIYGGTSAAFIWKDIMETAVKRFGHPIDFSAQQAAPTVAAISDRSGDRPKRSGPDPDVAAAAEEDAQRKRGEEQAKKDRQRETEVTTPDNGTPSPSPDEAGAPVTPPTDTIATPPTPPSTNEDVDNPKPKRDRRGRRKDSDESTVTVEVCADSGEIATPYCPETVTRTFAKGEAPRRRCHLHRPGG